MSLSQLVNSLKPAPSYPTKRGDLEIKSFISKEREYIANVGWHPKAYMVFHFPLRTRDEGAIKVLDGLFGKDRFSYQNFVQWLYYVPYEDRHNTPIGRLCCRLYTRTEAAGSIGEVDLETVLPVPNALDEKVSEFLKNLNLKT